MFPVKEGAHGVNVLNADIVPELSPVMGCSVGHLSVEVGLEDVTSIAFSGLSPASTLLGAAWLCHCIDLALCGLTTARDSPGARQLE